MPSSDGDYSDHAVKPVHKWPVRPGVHVHVTHVQSLSKLSVFGQLKAGETDTPASDSSTKSSTNGSGCSSYETRPVYESLAMHKTPSKTFAAPPPPGGRQFYTSGPPGQRQRHAEVATSIQNTRATPRRAQTSHFGRRRDGDSSTAGTPVHDAYAVQSGVPGYGAPSRVQKDYVPSEYAVLQFSGASHEIDV
ncbi:hypothetical protein FJT64_027499 [Amphibalanus amphitrite]|uniref:Uncharacterized protein n=1 Tax=Amphibalanus amphitrite TaxID=1232801 RepID=A0A6A4WD53_AMPAM|nr:hypothetical protein FJT64_027499 [Amphibalanus amphitrite]